MLTYLDFYLARKAYGHSNSQPEGKNDGEGDKVQLNYLTFENLKKRERSDHKNTLLRPLSQLWKEPIPMSIKSDAHGKAESERSGK